jgi:Na+-translocating ferredoxin:NAD+ oxidoreductase RnfC subunit
MAKFYCTQRFYQERTYYEEETYDLSKDEVAAFQKSGQIKRLRPSDAEAQAMLAGGDSLTAATAEGKPWQKMTRAELLALAKENGIAGAEEMTKAKLIDALAVETLTAATGE